jgi:hypothetical protein
MAKIQSLQRPGPFKKVVDIPTADGIAQVEFTFKYRKRTELAALQDSIIEDARKAAAEAQAKADAEAKAQAAAPATESAAAESKPPAPINHHTTFTAHLIRNGAQYIVDVADGWDLAEGLALETAQEFVDLYAGAIPAIAQAYNSALTDARLGN